MGPSGQICQYLRPASERKSINSRQWSLSVPIPNSPGRDEGCRRTPLALWSSQLKSACFTVGNGWILVAIESSVLMV